MSKKILILGGNPETSALFRVAKEMGLTTIACNPYPGSPVKEVADLAFDVDPTCADEIDRVIADNNVDAVLLGVSDPLLPFYKDICDRNELICYATDSSVRVFSSKSSFSRVSEIFGLSPIPQYGLATSSDFDSSELTYPVVVKPVDAGAAVGVSICNSKFELENGIVDALRVSIKKEAIVEKAMMHDDLFAYYTFIEGKIYLTAVADRFKSSVLDGLATVCLHAEYPSKHLSKFKKEVHPKLIDLFQSLNIQSAVLSIQFFFDGYEFFPYDPGFRIQGEAPHHYVEKLYGLDQRKLLINYALGLASETGKFEREIDPSFSGKFARTVWVLGKEGQVAEYFGVQQIRELPELVSIQARLKIGDKISVDAIGTERQVLFRIHLLGDSRLAVDLANQFIVENLKVLDVSGQSLIQDIFVPTMI